MSRRQVLFLDLNLKKYGGEVLGTCITVETNVIGMIFHLNYELDQ